MKTLKYSIKGITFKDEDGNTFRIYAKGNTPTQLYNSARVYSLTKGAKVSQLDTLIYGVILRYVAEKTIG